MRMCGKENCHDKCLMSVRALCKEKQIFRARNHQHYHMYTFINCREDVKLWMEYEYGENNLQNFYISEIIKRIFS